MHELYFFDNPFDLVYKYMFIGIIMEYIQKITCVFSYEEYIALIPSV